MNMKIVDTIANIAVRDGGGIIVEFSNGQKASLDPYASQQANAWAEILEELRRDGAPTYVEVKDGYITRLLIPHVARVKRLVSLPSGEFQVDLFPSQGRHLLSPAVPGYQQLLKALKLALNSGRLVFVTETPESHEIFDVTEAPNPKPPALAKRAPAVELDLAELRDVTPQRARELFALVCSKSCSDPMAPASPCIPFLYPDDGCDARAHEMCKLIIQAGEQPAKMWIKPSGYFLTVQTRNHPDCSVDWRWHMAAVLRVSLGDTTKIQVIDPALFTEPVSKLTWKSRHNDEQATLIPLASSVYDPEAGSVDPTYRETNYDLRRWRLYLKERSTRQDGPGPPPYKCPRAIMALWPPVSNLESGAG
jgi:hypothetical protein